MPNHHARIPWRIQGLRSAAKDFLRARRPPVWAWSLLVRLGRLYPPPPTVLQPPGRHPVAQDSREYAAWAERHPFGPAEERRAEALQARFAVRPLVSVIVPVHDPDLAHLQRALGSVEAQVYPEWEICVCDDASSDPAIRDFLQAFGHGSPRVRRVRLPTSEHIAGASNAAIALARGEYVAFLDHDDELAPDALFELVGALQNDPSTDIVYSDHDVLGVDGYRRHPNFKCDWSPELLLSYMYFGHLKMYRTALVRSVGGFREGFEGAADYDLALRIVEKTQRIRHVPLVLYHWRAAPRSMASTSETKPESFEAGRRAVDEALRRRGIDASAEHPPFAQQARIGVYRLAFRGTQEVPVTIIIPTRDKRDLLRDCVDSIESRTAHRAWRILILDNESRQPETIEYLSRSPHRVLRFESGGRFNFSAMMNFGVESCETDFFVLLNNDTVVIAPDWLDDMIGYGRLAGVGAVGAKLLYRDGRIQHAGVILGTHGLTGHAFQPRRDDDDELEYLCFAHVARNYLAVSAACMLSRKAVFQNIGGFDATNLGVAWNDVDYCLRLRDRGYRVVLDPHARLYHLESQSRGDDKNPSEIRYMLARWRHYIDRDPFYSPNLSCRDSEFRIKAEADEERHFYYREYR